VSKNTLGICVLSGLLIIFFSGCISAKAYTVSQENSTGRSMVVASDDSVIKIGNIEIKTDFFGRQNCIIPTVAGKQVVSVTMNLEHTVMEDSSSRTYVPYKAVWGTEYEFKPGKSYKITVKTVNLRYDGMRLVSSDSRVRISDARRPTVYFEGNDFITIEEYGFALTGGLIGSVYIGPYFNPGVEILFWDYGPGLGLNLGPSLGLQMTAGKFDMKIGGEAGVGAGIFYSLSPKDLMSSANYYYSAMIDLSFSKITIGAGYGILNHFPSYINSDDGEFWRSYPYAEINLKLPSGSNWVGGNSVGVFCRYFFNDTGDWNGKFAAGLRANL